MAFDYSKLLGKIKEVFGTQERFARAMGLSYASINKKLNNKVQWTQYEMSRALKLLGIEDKETAVYFFTPKV